MGGGNLGSFGVFFIWGGGGGFRGVAIQQGDDGGLEVFLAGDERFLVGFWRVTRGFWWVLCGLAY